jgi:hypothetical protein
MSAIVEQLRYNGIQVVVTSAAEAHVSSPLFDNRISEKWFDTEEAALFLKISPKCLLNLCSSGKVPYKKFGRRNRYLESDLRKLLLANPRGGFYGN